MGAHGFRHPYSRHHRENTTLPGPMSMLAANQRLRLDGADNPEVWLDAGRLRQAGMTWEDALSAVGSKVDKARLWETLIGSMGGVDTAVPATVPMYTWNLAGYQRGHTPSGTGNRHTFGGLTDQAFRMIPLLEAGANATWPWL